MSSVKCIISKHIVIDFKPIPIYGVIFIRNEVITDFIEVNPKIQPQHLLELYRQCNPINYENYYISPGIISFGAKREWESYTSLTQSAVSGGTTLLIEESPIYSNPINLGSLFCDIGWVQTIQLTDADHYLQERTPLALKAYLSNPSSNLKGIENNLSQIFTELQQSKMTLILDIIQPDQRMLYLASPCRDISIQQRKNMQILNDNETFAAAFPDQDEEQVQQLLVCQSDDSDKEETYEPSKLQDKRKIDLHIQTKIQILDQKVKKSTSLLKNLSSLELSTYSNSGETEFTPLSSPCLPFGEVNSPLLVDNTRSSSFDLVRQKREFVRRDLASLRPSKLFILKPTKVQTEMQPYLNLLSNSPDLWEINGIKAISAYLNQVQSKVHIANLSSAQAVNLLKDFKVCNSNISCSTCDHYLFFQSEDIGDGDTRFKDSPPIRDNENREYLWQFLELDVIDIVSAKHLAASSEDKYAFQGNFKRAINGVNTISSSFQAVWSKIMQRCSEDDKLGEFIVKLSAKMSWNVADLFGITNRGKIGKGYIADLMVWSPFQKFTVDNTFSDMQDTSLYYGLSLNGQVKEVYLRGQIAFDGKRFYQLGSFIS